MKNNNTTNFFLIKMNNENLNKQIIEGNHLSPLPVIVIGAKNL